MPTPPLRPAKSTAWYRQTPHLLIILIGLMYVALVGRFRAFDLDDAWFLSFSHSFWSQHISTDTFMLQKFPMGMGGVVAFGKLAAILQGIVLGPFGWSLTAGSLLSVAFVVGGLFLLADMCRELEFSEHFTACFIALVGLSEAFVWAAEKTRYEFLALFLLCLGLWLASRRWIACAMFAAALATEVEPAAIVVPCAVFVAIVVQNRAGRVPRLPLLSLLSRVVAGAAAAFAVYYLLHPNFVTIFKTADWAAVKSGHLPGGFVAAYYAQYKRHLPDLLLVLAALAVALSMRRRVLLQWPALCSLTVLLISALLGWGNVPYFCFIVPFLSLFVLQVLYSERYWRWIVAALLLYSMPQYAYRIYYWSLHPPLTQADQNAMSGALDRAAATIGKQPPELRIIGDFNLWYAHPNNFVDFDTRVVTLPLLENSDVLVCFDKTLDPILAEATSGEMPCDALTKFPVKASEILSLHGHRAEVKILPHR